MATSTARFTGTLAELGTADLIQLLQLAGKDAWITIQQPELESRLWCRAGAVVDAESGRLRGEAAAYRILGFDEGFLIAELRPVERTREIDVGTPRLLLEAARRKDECAQLWARLGDPQRCYRCEGAAPDQGAKEQGLLQSFAAGRSLAEVLAESELGDWEALQAIVRWRDAGALVDAGSVATVAAQSSSSRSELAPPDAQEHSSTAPLEVAQRERRASSEGPLPAWSYAALAALVLVSSGYAFGMRAARSRAEALPPTPAAAPAPPAARSHPESFSLELQVEPGGAEIVLDGSHIATGSFATRLPRDGRPHELRVSSAGFIDTRIWFVDAAPPKQLRLEPLPASNVETAAAPAEATVRVSPRVTRARKAPRSELNESAEASPKVDTAATPAPGGAPATPVVRLIE